jgi:hypothetical protein
MLLLLKSFGMLWAWNGPPAESEKHPRDAKPWIAKVVVLAVVLRLVLNAVEVTSVDMDEIWFELLDVDDDIEEVAEEDAGESA